MTGSLAKFLQPPFATAQQHSLSIALPESYNYRKLSPMSFASLINLRSQRSPFARGLRKSFRSSYNPSVKWKSSKKKVSLRFSRTMPPVICAHLLISSPSFTALRPALSPPCPLRIVSRSDFLEVFAFLFQTSDGSRGVIFKMAERPWHRFFRPLHSFFSPFLSTLSSSVAAFIPSVAGLPLPLSLTLSFHCLLPRVLAHSLVLSG